MSYLFRSVGLAFLLRLHYQFKELLCFQLHFGFQLLKFFFFLFTFLVKFCLQQLLSERLDFLLFFLGKLVQIIVFCLLQDCLKVIVLFCCCLINVSRVIAYRADNVVVLVASLTA